MTKIIVRLTEEDGTVVDEFAINCENAIEASHDVREQVEWKFEINDDVE